MLIKKILKKYWNDILNFRDLLLSPLYAFLLWQKKRSWLSPVELTEYRNKIKVYDIFCFFNELELLEIRFNILDEYVDFFVLIEATETFTGLPKKLFYEENKHLFEKWQHKIIHYVIKDTPRNKEELLERLKESGLSALDKRIIQETLTTKYVPEGQDHWMREFYQKETAHKALLTLSDADFCFISDLDEIWNPQVVIDFSKDDLYRLKQKSYVYFLNNRSNENWKGWAGTIGTKYKNIKDSCINNLRNQDNGVIIPNGGWHFTFQGGKDRIKSKLESYGHQEINTENIKSKITTTLAHSKDIRGRHIAFWVDESELPSYLLESKQKYKNFFL